MWNTHKFVHHRDSNTFFPPFFRCKPTAKTSTTWPPCCTAWARTLEISAKLLKYTKFVASLPQVQVNCEDLDDSATLLYGMGKKRGLLYWLRDGGTLLLNNVHKAAPAVQPLLKQVGVYCMGAGRAGRCCWV